MEQPKKNFKLVSTKNTRVLLPNIFTLVGVCIGLSSIKFAFDGRFEMAVLAIIVAGIIDGLDGRIKSSLGIGSLLNDGIGDTIRVSLTEDPEFEIPTAKKIIDKIRILNPINKGSHRLSEYHKRSTSAVLNIGGDNVPVVLSSSNTLFEGNGPDYFYDEKGLINDKNERFPYFDSIKKYRQ